MSLAIDDAVIVVLTDGETYTNLGSSYVAVLTPDQVEELDEGFGLDQLDNKITRDQSIPVKELLDFYMKLNA